MNLVIWCFIFLGVAVGFIVIVSPMLDVGICATNYACKVVDDYDYLKDQLKLYNSTCDIRFEPLEKPFKLKTSECTRSYPFEFVKKAIATRNSNNTEVNCDLQRFDLYEDSKGNIVMCDAYPI